MFARFTNRVARLADRRAAGRELAQLLAHYCGRGNLVVLGLPRGGVPVALEVARALGAPLDVFVVRKLGVPGHSELAMGAIASGGVRALNLDVISALGITPAELEAVSERELDELERREREYRGEFEPLALGGQTVIVVDDGLATGATMRAAVRALRHRHTQAIVVAVPVAAAQTCAELASDADEVVCARTPERFAAVGLWYRDFSATSDEEVRELLAHARTPPALAARQA
jgi:putative phosphoribosyl transferase